MHPGGSSCTRKPRRCWPPAFFHVDCAVTLQRLYCFSSWKPAAATCTSSGSQPIRTGRGPPSRSAIFCWIPVTAPRTSGSWSATGLDRTASFDAVLSSAGIEAVKIPPRSPGANAYAERFVLTARTEVTDRMLIFGQRHLRRILAQYEAHYNGRRPHRSRQLRPPRPDHPVADLTQERIQRCPVLGGLINEYERAA